VIFGRAQTLRCPLLPGNPRPAFRLCGLCGLGVTGTVRHRFAGCEAADKLIAKGVVSRDQAGEIGLRIQEWSVQQCPHVGQVKGSGRQ
jgi:hypothetical protein